MFYAILKDWSKQKAKHDHEYPQSPVVKVEFTVSDEEIAEIDKYLRSKIDEIILYEKKPDAELPTLFGRGPVA